MYVPNLCALKQSLFEKRFLYCHAGDSGVPANGFPFLVSSASLPAERLLIIGLVMVPLFRVTTHLVPILIAFGSNF